MQNYFSRVQIGNVEVWNINPVTQSLSLVVHTDSVKTEQEIMMKCRNTCQYLQKEGFIPSDLSKWKVSITGVKD